MKNIIICKSNKEREFLYGNNERKKSIVIPSYSTMLLSGNKETDSIRIHAFSRHKSGVRFIDFGIYLQMDTKNYFGIDFYKEWEDMSMSNKLCND